MTCPECRSALLVTSVPLHAAPAWTPRQVHCVSCGGRVSFNLPGEVVLVEKLASGRTPGDATYGDDPSGPHG
jgi:hypothetical protein